ncbi:MAG: ribonuclease R [Candidatus Cardinium sp.]|nr:ribonuclease R [Candidatus Cardinium sp.]
MHNTPNKKEVAQQAEQILQALKKAPDKSYTFQQLCTLLQLTEKKDKAAVKKALLDLIHHSKVKKINKGRYQWLQQSTYVIGRVDYVRAEYAYIIAPDQPKDILVFQKDLLSALDKDLVKVRLCASKRRHRPEGVVVEIMERNPSPVIGRVVSTGKQAQAIITQRHVTHVVLLEETEGMSLQEDDKAVIALTAPHGIDNQLTGTIVQHLGQAGLHEVEMHAIMAEFGLRNTFPEEVLASIQTIPTAIPETEITKRRDLRAIPTFTIDPADAKDLDDALSYQKLPNGYHQVGIHIADVSYYVLPATLLDQEAYKRNTSVYLVDRCIPMLPELLSNELCSLHPGSAKLAFSVIFELDDQGKVHNKWFGETVITSYKQFTYEEAQATLDKQTAAFYQELVSLNALAKQLRAKRFKKGAINFETRELRFTLDPNGKPLQIVPKVTLETHKLIEEFMLLANREVATYVAKKIQSNKNEKKNEIAPVFIYRTHDKPDPSKLSEFFLFVQQLGYTIKPGNRPIFKTMHHLEEAIRGKPEEPIIQALAIRSMAKALYTTKPNPHFALAFSHYSHFTSPIRRYSDIVAHRLLKLYLKGKWLCEQMVLEEANCQYAVEREYIAASAERASIKYKQVEFLQNLKNETFDGIISGITEWNLYIEIVTNGCEGVVRLADLTDDVYRFEAKQFQVIGKYTKKCYRLGDSVKVSIKSCDLDKRYVYFCLHAHAH